ncbi:SDR family oxidoreductase [Streptomyces mirabilis]|jgi:dihydroanticapsin dehydrogenase|nr:SDR family oxidoreductase [Streptomyces mirabilis]
MPAKALATDFDADGIRVNCVAPSIVDTPMSRADLRLTGKDFEGQPFPVHRPEEIAAAAISSRTWHEVSTARFT